MATVEGTALARRWISASTRSARSRAVTIPVRAGSGFVGSYRVSVLLADRVASGALPVGDEAVVVRHRAAAKDHIPEAVHERVVSLDALGIGSRRVVAVGRVVDTDRNARVLHVVRGLRE